MKRLQEPQLIFSKSSVLGARHLHIPKICQMVQDVPATEARFIKRELRGLQLFMMSTGEKTRTWHLCYKNIYIILIIL